MNAHQRTRKPAILPFLLLVLAWICANGPQSLTSNVALWAKGARHFSHQQQLRADVHSLLTGLHRKEVLVAERAPLPTRPAVPLSERTVAKGIDLAVSRDSGSWLTPSERDTFAPGEFRVETGERAEPLQQPPRTMSQV